MLSGKKSDQCIESRRCKTLYAFIEFDFYLTA